MQKWSLVVWIVLFCLAPLSAQRIEGVVYERCTKEPLSGVFPHLRGVLNMYNAGMPNEKIKPGTEYGPKKSQMLKKLDLSESELQDLENFLESLHSTQYKMRAPELPK